MFNIYTKAAGTLTNFRELKWLFKKHLKAGPLLTFDERSLPLKNLLNAYMRVNLIIYFFIESFLSHYTIRHKSQLRELFGKCRHRHSFWYFLRSVFLTPVCLYKSHASFLYLSHLFLVIHHFFLLAVKKKQK